jgi:hypothetical protein
MLVRQYSSMENNTSATRQETRRSLPRWAQVALGGLGIWAVAGPAIAGGLVYILEESRHAQPRTVTITGECLLEQTAVGAYVNFVVPGGQSGRFVQPPELAQIPGHPNKARFTIQAPDNASLVTASFGCDFVPGTQHGTQGEWAHNDPATDSDGAPRWFTIDDGSTVIGLTCSNKPDTAGRTGTGTTNGSCVPTR